MWSLYQGVAVGQLAELDRAIMDPKCGVAGSLSQPYSNAENKASCHAKDTAIHRTANCRP